MNWTRAVGLIVIFGVALAQESVLLRFTVAVDTVINYGGKSETNTGQSFVFATGPDGSSRVPNGLKAAFERGQLTRYGLVAGIQTSFYNSTETVHDLLEDGSRVVLIEQVSQGTSGLQLGAAQKVTAEMTRIHKPDGHILLEDVFVNAEGDYVRDEDTNVTVRTLVAESVSNNLKINAQLLEACYTTQPGSGVPFKLDPEALGVTAEDGKPEDGKLEPVRVGDVRVQIIDGLSECRISINPSQYGLKQGSVKIVQRLVLQFANNGLIERNEFVSSVTYGEVEASDFEFEGKTYRVRAIPVSKTTGSGDRLR